MSEPLMPRSDILQKIETIQEELASFYFKTGAEVNKSLNRLYKEKFSLKRLTEMCDDAGYSAGVESHTDDYIKAFESLSHQLFKLGENVYWGRDEFHLNYDQYDSADESDESYNSNTWTGY